MTQQTNPADRCPPAFILTGAFAVVCRNPLYLTELRRRGLKILVLTAESWRKRATAAQQDPEHVAQMIDEIAFVEGSFDVEGSFTAGAIAQAQNWRDRYTIRGVYAVGETLVEPTGIVADALGLPGPGLRASRVCRSKYLQRWYLSELSPVSVTVPGGQRAAFDPYAAPFPAVLKPASRHSSSGVITVETPAQLAEAVASYPEHEHLLVEEKVVGQEYSVECLVQEGKTIFASVTRKETTESHANTFVEISHSVPEGHVDVQAMLLDANQQLLERLDFGSGIAHSEWRVDARGRVYLMEVAARTPGDGLLALYQLATGAALEPVIMRISLGEPASYPSPRRFTRQVYLEHPVGTLNDVAVDWPEVRPLWLSGSGVWPVVPPGASDEPPTLRAVFVLKDRGSRLGELRESDDRVVTFFIDAPVETELDELERRVRAAITVHVSDSAQ
ncbi:ATP-grasp domain-containing protein [Salinispora oceanensis]|uniref:ATP-grasp domain-containing protein n=1 Tax=Salinispora oceanensis TaxID=1050199 RepID=UPI00035F8764|nr:ATP-grasp domain-containing protein [Salinispora oceanensis]